MDIRFLGAALSPLLVFFFACEMSALTDAYYKNRIPERTAHRMMLYVILKLPVSVIAPALLQWTGAAIIALLDIMSIAAMVAYDLRCRRENT